jgi:isopenicillin-N N-acyltransferase like protein
MRRSCGVLLLVISVMLPSSAAAFECYRTSVGSGANEIPVVVVGGTPYEMGRAFGRLMSDEVKRCILGWLTPSQKGLPERYNDAALDAAWDAIRPYTHERFEQELKGLADGSGVSYEVLRRAHMIPVVSNYACSGVAVWGRATKSGHLLQLRNLDFTINAGLQDYLAIVVYVPKKGIAHVNVTFAGFVGSHTGMNAEGVVLGEKGESPEKEYPFDLDGIHFSTLFRDMLYEARDLDDAIAMVKSAKRIKRFYWYISGGQDSDQRAVKIKVTTPDRVGLHIWTDNDKTDELAPWVFKNAIYHTMNNKVAFKDLKANWGKYDPDKMIALSRAVASKGGNLCNVVYDATTLELWVAIAQKKKQANTQPYVHVRMKDYLDPTKVPAGAVLLSEKP